MVASSRFGAVFVALLSAVALLSSAQQVCNGVIEGKIITSDVNVVGGACTLKNTNITGSVRVTKGGTIETLGKVVINGCLHGFKSGTMTLTGMLTVQGGLSVLESTQEVLVGSGANVGTTSMVAVESFVSSGTLSSLSVTDGVNVGIFGGEVTGGGVFRRGGNGKTEFCGTDVAGGISLDGVTGPLIVQQSSSCPATNIDGSISVARGTGNILLNSGTYVGVDVLVEEHKGTLDAKNVDLSDVSVSNLDGSVKLTNVKADSDVSLGGVTGTVTLMMFTTQGDIKLDGVNDVVFQNNDFGLEDVALVGTEGSITIKGNKNFSLNIVEAQGPIVFNNNEGINFGFFKNKGSITVNGNTAETITCVDNTVKPTGSGNTIQLNTPGQCSGF